MTNFGVIDNGSTTGPSSYIGSTAGGVSSLAGDAGGGFFGDSFSNLNNSLGTIGKIGGGISSLAGIYSGFKMLGMAEDELDIKKDQWSMAKEELQHMQESRKRITAGYMGGNSGVNRNTGRQSTLSANRIG